ncbi:MAG: ethanolamine ammonia-lyase subunit EutC [Desulfobacterales bacterium]|nr:ethanolamine ammonia-lyase subunit EutC [Desulfobacterales bacterium]
MISEEQLKHIIEGVLSSLDKTEADAPASYAAAPVSDDEIEDFGAIDLRSELLVPGASNDSAYLKLKETTPARLGIWRTGPRYLTRTMLRFRADHASAQDAVFNSVSKEFIKDWGILEVSSACQDKDEFLTRPDLGRILDEENADILRQNCKKAPRVQIVIIDGLSSTAVEVNARDTYESLMQGLKGHGIETGTPFFIRNGRVPSMDCISEILEPEVTIALVGERPGLATAESLSCYASYKASTTRPESNRTVVSNIHKMGTPAVEAGAHIADIVAEMLKQKASGIDLKL